MTELDTLRADLAHYQAELTYHRDQCLAEAGTPAAYDTYHAEWEQGRADGLALALAFLATSTGGAFGTSLDEQRRAKTTHEGGDR